jgi:hypothetical protein
MSMSRKSLLCGYGLLFLASLCFLVLPMLLFSGCQTPQATHSQGNWFDQHLYDLATNKTVIVTTNIVFQTNTIPVYREQVERVLLTQMVAGVEQVIPKTNVITITNYQTEVIPTGAVRLDTNQILKTEFIPKPMIDNVIGGAGAIPLPYAGFASAILLGLYHGYAQLRNKRVNKALVLGGEGVLSALNTTPEGQALRAKAIQTLKDTQEKLGVRADVAKLVDELTKPQERV